MSFLLRAFFFFFFDGDKRNTLHRKVRCYGFSSTSHQLPHPKALPPARQAWGKAPCVSGPYAAPGWDPMELAAFEAETFWPWELRGGVRGLAAAFPSLRKGRDEMREHMDSEHLPSFWAPPTFLNYGCRTALPAFGLGLHHLAWVRRSPCLPTELSALNHRCRGRMHSGPSPVLRNL